MEGVTLKLLGWLYRAEQLPNPTNLSSMKQITVVFKVDHEPGTDEHLEAILENYFRGKGIEYEDGKIII